MNNLEKGKLLRCLISEKDRWQGKPLHEAIVSKCRELKIAGASVFRGLEGYGGAAEIHRPHLVHHDLPILVTVVDSEENIQRLLPVLESLVDKALIALSDVEMRRVEKNPPEAN